MDKDDLLDEDSLVEDKSVTLKTFLYVCLIIYFVMMFVVGCAAHKRKTAAAEDQGRLQAHFGGAFGPGLLILTTFSTVYSGFTVTGVPAEAYLRGFISLRWIGATLVIVLGMLIFYPRLRRLAVVRQYRSPNDFVTDRYRSATLRLLCAFCAVVPLLLYVTAQMVAFAAIWSGITSDEVPKWMSMLGFAVVILILERLGGMHSVVFTDALQSAIMLCAFVCLPLAIGHHFGYIWDIGPDQCRSLMYVKVNTTGLQHSPDRCHVSGAQEAEAAGCTASGCLKDVQPGFYDYPDGKERADILFFLMNMFAAPLQPQMVQRAYIAENDNALKLVMGAMLVAPFVAQTPGILTGLTKAAMEPAWPKATRHMTAFSAVSEALVGTGSLVYLLVMVMTCSTLAAIMSTADSALMGASSIVSIDIYKGIFRPDATEERMVRVGELNSVVFALAAVVLGLFLTVPQFGSLIIFQNGMLMQLVPAYGFGLYFEVSSLAVLMGMVAGLLVLVGWFIIGLFLESPQTILYVPPVNISVFVNFFTVIVVQQLMAFGVIDSSEDASSFPEKPLPKVDGDEEEVAFTDLPILRPDEIRRVMMSSREPNRVILALMVVCTVLAVPWYREANAAVSVHWGIPQWGVIEVAMFLAVFALGQVATASWRPEHAAETISSDEEDSDEDSAE